MRKSASEPVRRAGAVSTVLAAVLATVTGLAAPAPAAEPATTSCSAALRNDINGDMNGDINGDGHADAVITEYGRTRLEGGIHVLYGTSKGLTASPTGTALDDQFLTQDSPGIPGTSEPMDEWGATLALGDFDGDKCADLAVGTPGEDEASGSVTVVYGSATGLAARAAKFSQSSAGVKGASEPNDRFGAALAAGDFDGDGLADLAVGVPGETVGTAFGAGSLAILYGSAKGLGGGRATKVTYQGTETGAMGARAEEGDRAGAALAAGDFTKSGFDSLAIGVPGEDGSGALMVLAGGRDDLAARATSLHRSTSGVPGSRQAGDLFAATLAAGDLDGDGADDLAVGIPGEKSKRGAVSVVYSAGSAGLTGARTDYWTQDSDGIGSDAAAGDGFGSALAVGRLNSGSIEDLAVGVPTDAVGLVAGAGAVNVLLGSPKGLSSAGSLWLNQEVSGVTGTAVTGDKFGHSVTTARIEGSGIDNLIVGVPAEGVTGTASQNAGAFQFFGNGSKGPSASGSKLWTLEEPGVRGVSAPGTYLGFALT